MRSKFVFFLAAVIFCFNCFLKAQTRFSANAVREDLKHLYETLEVSHYNLFAVTKKEVFDKEYQRIIESIKDSLTLLEASRLLMPFTALSRHSHCSIELPFSSYVPYVMNGGTVFPLNLYFNNNQALVLDNYSGDSTIVPGDEIISINGNPIEEVMNGIYNYLSGESTYLKNSSIDLIYFPRIYWVVYDKCDSFKVVIKKKNNTLTEKLLNAIAAVDFEGKTAQKKRMLNENRELSFINGAAYLHPGTFLNASNNGIMEHQTFENSEFLNFIDSAFIEIHERKLKNLIIDLRGNPGGDNSFSDPMVAYFAKEPFSFCSKFQVRTSQVTKEFWKAINDSSLLSLKAGILSHENGARFEISMPKNNPRNDSLHFTGKVYLLINRYSYSNAAVTAAMIQDYKFGKLIGEPTADLPSTYAAAHQFKLPNTQLTVTYPKAYIIRPGGDTSTNGTIPDYKVEDNLFTAEDEILDYTLKLIEENKN